MTEFGIGYMLPNDASTYHRNLWQKIEDQFKLTGSAAPSAPPHITLKYPCQAENIQEVEQVLRAFSANQVKTKWAVKGFNYFHRGADLVIFMDVLPSPAARKTHARLLDALRQIPWMQWGEFDTAEMHYHVTLAHQGLTTQNFESVWSFVNQHRAPNFELFFDHLTLVQLEEETGKFLYKQYWLLDDTAVTIPTLITLPGFNQNNFGEIS